MSRNYKIGIIVFDGVLTSEVMGPAEVFAMANGRDWFSAEVLLVGVENQPTIRTEEGITLKVDTMISEDLELDILLVAGGNDVSHLLQHTALNAFIKRHEDTAEWLGSYCAGAFVLGSAGVLDGKQATTWHGGEPSLQAQFPAIEVVEDTPVVLDKRRITANGGLVSYRAALVLLGQLTSAEHAQEIYHSLGMGRLGTWDEITASIHEVPA